MPPPQDPLTLAQWDHGLPGTLDTPGPCNRCEWGRALPCCLGQLSLSARGAWAWPFGAQRQAAGVCLEGSQGGPGRGRGRG